MKLDFYQDYTSIMIRLLVLQDFYPFQYDMDSLILTEVL